MLKSFGEDVWITSGPFSMFGLRIGVRMTVVRLKSGEIWIHSPLPLTSTLRDEVAALGPVRHIVAPNLYHHLYVGPWHHAFPEATVHAPSALEKKRPDLRIGAALADAERAVWASELVPITIDGTLLHETVFVHGRSRSLISADLTENFQTSDHLPTRLYLKAAGIHGRIGWSRLLRVMYRDHAQTRRSIDRLLTNDFDRIVLAHGDPIERNGHDAVRQTFHFLRA